MCNCWLVLCGFVRLGSDLSNRSPLYRVMSRNVSSVSLNSYVNLIVWCNWLIVFMYVVNSDADPVQMTNMSSMNLFHS